MILKNLYFIGGIFLLGLLLALINYFVFYRHIVKLDGKGDSITFNYKNKTYNATASSCENGISDQCICSGEICTIIEFEDGSKIVLSTKNILPGSKLFIKDPENPARSVTTVPSAYYTLNAIASICIAASIFLYVLRSKSKDKSEEAIE